MVLGIVRLEAGPHERCPKMLKESWKTTLEIQGT
jgi:hypothetical protein